MENKINEIFKNHNLMHLATVDSSGTPHVRGVDYAHNSPGTVYFMTHKASRKIQHIENNTSVSIVVDHDCPDMASLQEVIYLKGTGTATIVADMSEIEMAAGLLMQKFPHLSDLPFDPADMRTVRVDLKAITVTDNTISFGHSDQVEF